MNQSYSEGRDNSKGKGAWSNKDGSDYTLLPPVSHFPHQTEVKGKGGEERGAGRENRKCGEGGRKGIRFHGILIIIIILQESFYRLHFLAYLSEK